MDVDKVSTRYSVQETFLAQSLSVALLPVAIPKAIKSADTTPQKLELMISCWIQVVLRAPQHI